MRRLLVSLLLAVAACGGGGSDGSAPPPPEGPPLPADPVVEMDAGLKQLVFSWTEIADADYYRLLENPDGHSGFTQVGGNIPTQQTSVTRDIAAHLFDFTEALYIVEACNGSGCSSSAEVNPTEAMLDTIGYVKALNTDAFDLFGCSVAVSGDGHTIAVGSQNEDGAATEINGDAADNSVLNSGAVYIYKRIDGQWNFTDYIKASNAAPNDRFGYAVALNYDGSRLVVGAPLDAGAYVFEFANGQWQEQAYLEAAIQNGALNFGSSLDIDADGDTIVVSAHSEFESGCGAGAVYLFRYTDFAWWQEARVVGANTEGANCEKQWDGDNFGFSVTLSGDGNLFVAGAPGEDSQSTGIDGDPFNDVDEQAEIGAAYVFRFDAGIWVQEAYVKPATLGHVFGQSVAIESNGMRFVVGRFEDARIFENDGNGWFEATALYPSNPAVAKNFGEAVAISGDGTIIAVGDPRESSTSAGVNGDQYADGGEEFAAGAVYVFRPFPDGWNQVAYVKSTNPDNEDFFGWDLSMADDGSTMAIGAAREDGGGTGLTANPADNSAENSGAAYLY